MAEMRKRLSKKASKILFEIICEDSFEGNCIKTILPATRRISKTREGLWEYIRSELVRRSEEQYDLGTLSAAWYYNLRKIGSCLDQIEMNTDSSVSLEKLRTMEKYVCDNMGGRIRGRGNGSIETAGDVKLSRTEMLTLSRQSTMDASVNYSFDVVTMNSLTVKNERRCSNDVNKSIDPGESENAQADGTEIRDDGRIQRDIYDPTETVENARVETNDGIPFDNPFGDEEIALFDHPIPSRYNTPDTTFISRNNSTMSVSGYDADNEKGLIKRRRKEMRAGRERVVKVEEDVDEGMEQKDESSEEQHDNGGANGADDVAGLEEEEQQGRRTTRTKLDNLKGITGIIENLRDHIVSLRNIGALDVADLETLAESFEQAGKLLSKNMDAV